MVEVFVVSSSALVAVAYATFSEHVTLTFVDIFSVFPTVSYATFSEQVTLAGPSFSKAGRKIIVFMESTEAIVDKLHVHEYLVDATNNTSFTY